MKALFLGIFIISSICFAGIVKDPDQDSNNRPTVLIGTLKDYFYPGLEDKIAQIWSFTLANTSVIQVKSKIENPIIYFAPFLFEKEDPSWVIWQKSWIQSHPEIWEDWKKQSNGRPPIEEGNPFPNRFAAFEYYGSSRIQIDPGSSFIPYYQYDDKGNRRDIAGLGYYAVGHELHHYALNLIGVPIKLHHCLFVRATKSSQNSYMDRLAVFLIQQNISSELVKFRGSDGEAMMNPCRYLTPDENAEVDRWIEKL